MENEMSEIANLMNNLSKSEGFNESLLKGVGIFKATHPRPREPLCYEQGIIIVGQGSKRVFLGGKMYEYNKDNYLVLTVPIPAECETFAKPQEPLLALTVDFEATRLNRVISKMHDHLDLVKLQNIEKQAGLFLSKTTEPFRDTVFRLLKALQSPEESSVIGEAIIDELVFRVMQGENASSLYALAMNNTNLSMINKALQHIHSNFNKPMEVENLSSLVHMSPSAFHRAFKDVTLSSPMQYLKKIRLNRARTLLMDKGSRVNEAANLVGYESTSQFSREFKRYYGTSPVKYINAR